MNVARNAGEVLAEHATLDLECIDRMYLNVYVPMLQSGAGAAYFFRKVRGNPVPSSALMEPMTRRFVAALRGFVRDSGVDLIRFERRERKDDRTKEYLARLRGRRVRALRRRGAGEGAGAAHERRATAPCTARTRGWCRRRRW